MRDAIRAGRRGGIVLDLTDVEREAILRVPQLLREVVASSDTMDPGYRRLFPPAYDDDPSRNEIFASRTHDPLAQQRLEAASVVEKTVGAKALTPDEVRHWLDACNDARLLLGSRLAATEDMTPDDVPAEQAHDLALYAFLSYLVGRMVVVSGGPEQDELTEDILRRAARERGEGV
jgi:hypothetical protein